MGIPAVILPIPPSGPERQHELMEYARVLHMLALDAKESNVQIWVKTMLSDHSLAEFETLHRLCDGASNIGMILWMEQVPINTANTAAATVASQIILLHKAIGSQLKAVAFPTKVFLTNKRGYPTLAKR